MEDRDGSSVGDVPDRVNIGEESDLAPAREGNPGAVARADLPAMQAALTALESLDQRGRARVLVWLADALEVQSAPSGAVRTEPLSNTRVQTAVTAVIEGGEAVPSPRDFISRKRPASHVERVACLAYYLDRYRNTPHFRTPDIVDLNTDAAGAKFGNPSRDVDNADRQNGYLVTAGNGAKQLTVRGEAMVDALPDRDAVKVALREHPYKGRRRDGGNKKSQGGGGNVD